jgi:hypothetical protein
MSLKNNEPVPGSGIYGRNIAGNPEFHEIKLLLLRSLKRD